MGYAGIPFLQQDLTSVKRISARLTESRRLREAGVRGMKWGQKKKHNALVSDLNTSRERLRDVYNRGDMDRGIDSGADEDFGD